MEDEIWKDVVGFEEYFQISNFGRVWSKRTSKILKQQIACNGYPVISSKIGGRKGKCIYKKVHRWVAEAFIKNPKNKPYVNHKDGDKRNNHYSNLEWVTSSENIQHAFDTGLNKAVSGENHFRSKLTREDVENIKQRYVPYCKVNGCRSIAKEYNVDHSTISHCINHKSYISGEVVYES